VVNRFRLDLQYEGTRYCGWQIQPNGITVQEVLQEKLSQLCNKEIEVVGCGRTDSGVHASYYVAHFDFEGELPKELPYRLNKMLPEDIAIFHCQPVSMDFHARFSAVKRSYEYRIHWNKQVFLSDYSWWNAAAQSLDWDLANQAAQKMIGTHPFSAFCKGDIPNNNPDCTVFEASWVSIPQGMQFQISANRFLRNMVRATVGTLLEIGQHKMTLDQFEALLLGGKRSDAGNSVPACGLYLTDVTY